MNTNRNGCFQKYTPMPIFPENQNEQFTLVIWPQDTSLISSNISL